MQTLTEIIIRLANTREVSYNVDEDAAGPAYFLLSVRKCGSSLFNQIAQSMARANAIQFVDVAGTFFKNNVKVDDWAADPAIRDLLRAGNAYGGFRNMPVALIGAPAFSSGRKILFIRDPRDALVSEYFSVAFSHAIPEPTGAAADVKTMMLEQRKKALISDIDAWVLKRSRSMALAMDLYRQILPDVLLLRYEDFIYRKRDLIRAMAGHLGWTVDTSLEDSILGWADVRPAVEDSAAFIRRVAPGDHREKLREDTIAELTRVLQPILSAFGYAEPDVR
jgi:hypothetical protein